MSDDAVTMTYSEKIDILGIWIPGPEGRTKRTVQVTSSIHVDLDENGKCSGIDILDASWHMPIAALRRLPERESWSTMAEASAESGLSRDTLRVLLNRGKLEGKKLGRDWLVDGASLWNYLEEREARGRQPKSAKGKRLRAKQLTSR